MLPSYMSPYVVSNAERKIFEWFKSSKGTDDWIVLHSLGLSNHDKVIYGEIDFLVIAPNLGIFAIEVKGGRVSRKNGIWYFTDRFGHTDSRTRSPFSQANEGVFNVVKYLKDKIDTNHDHLKNIIFGFGVMFPDIKFDLKDPEIDDAQIFDNNNGNDVLTFIHKLSFFFQKRISEIYNDKFIKSLPSKEDVFYIASLLRSDFEIIPSKVSQIKYNKQSIIQLTQEQYYCLDLLEDNQRTLIQGYAGTGKTFIAIEAVKRSVIQGKKVAFFCFNSTLGGWLEHYFSLPQNEPIRPLFVGTFHKFLTKLLKSNDFIQVEKFSTFDLDYFKDLLPTEVLKILSTETPLFDEIIIDEAQDLVFDNYLKVINSILKKGLKRGNWIMFGDFCRQAIYNQGISGNKLMEKIEKLSSFGLFTLHKICRNTNQICREIRNIVELNLEERFFSKLEGPTVNYLFWRDEKEQLLKLENILDKLAEDKTDFKEITILSPNKKQKSVVRLLSKYKIENYKLGTNSGITFSTIHSFKGMENSIIILTDLVDLKDSSLLYVGFSRACFSLYVLGSIEFKNNYNDLIIRRICNGQ